jgi:hypothetical protein
MAPRRRCSFPLNLNCQRVQCLPGTRAWHSHRCGRCWRAVTLSLLSCAAVSLAARRIPAARVLSQRLLPLVNAMCSRRGSVGVCGHTRVSDARCRRHDVDVIVAPSNTWPSSTLLLLRVSAAPPQVSIILRHTLALCGKGDPWPADKVSDTLDCIFGSLHAAVKPITDVVVVHKGEPVPDGFTKARGPSCVRVSVCVCARVCVCVFCVFCACASVCLCVPVRMSDCCRTCIPCLNLVFTPCGWRCEGRSLWRQCRDRVVDCDALFAHVAADVALIVTVGVVVDRSTTRSREPSTPT